MDRKWDIKTIYLYLVSFVTLMMILFGTVNGVQALFEYMYRPADLDKPPVWDYKMPIGDYGLESQKNREIMELERERMAQSMRYERLRRIFNSAATIFIALPVYFYHWRKINQ